MHEWTCDCRYSCCNVCVCVREREREERRPPAETSAGRGALAFQQSLIITSALYLQLSDLFCDNIIIATHLL